MKPILVIGDSCIDRFVYCHCDRLCPEAPVPVLDVLETTENEGMAGNVFRNILSLNYPCDLVTNSNYKKIIKTRYVDKRSNHQFIRVDNNDKTERIDLSTIDFEKYGAVIISDYNKGFLEWDDIARINYAHDETFLDTKKILGRWAERAKFIKINRAEYNLSKNEIRDFYLEDKIIQTLGDGGCQYQGKIYPVKPVEIKNLSGAGDSFIAGLVVHYLLTNDMESSLTFANECATIVVQKAGVSRINE